MFGLASMELMHRTLQMLEEDASPEVQQIVRPLLRVSHVSQQALKPLVRHSVREAKDYRIKMRQASTASIAEPALKKKLCCPTISSHTLFEEDSISSVEKSVENSKQRHVKMVYDFKRKKPEHLVTPPPPKAARLESEENNQLPKPNYDRGLFRGKSRGQGKSFYFQDKFGKRGRSNRGGHQKKFNLKSNKQHFSSRGSQGGSFRGGRGRNNSEEQQ